MEKSGREVRARMKKLDFDDKDVGIIAVAVIAIVALLMMGAEGKDIAVAAVSAIAGVVTGRKLEKGGGKGG